MGRLSFDQDDLQCIYRALERGADVRIQNTKDGVRIVEDTVKVLKRKTMMAGSPKVKTRAIRYEYTEKD